MAPADPSNIARFVRLCRLLILLGLGTFFAAQAGYGFANADSLMQGWHRALRYVVGPALLAIFFWSVASKAGESAKNVVAAYGSCILGALIAFEIFPALLARSEPPKRALAESMARREAGEDSFVAFTLMQANQALKTDARTDAVLSNVPDIQTVACWKEDGWVTFRADAEGFNNPSSGERATRPPLELAVLGDSFIQGFCLHRQEALVGQIAERIPNSRGFGVTGNGPLFELEILKAYVAKWRPKVVAWVFFEGNDLGDLEQEMKLDWLFESLDSPRPPESELRTAESLASFQRYVWTELAPKPPSYPINWFQAFALFRTSTLLGLHYGRAGGEEALFERILARARTEVEGWGGRLVFVYLPEAIRYHGLFPHKGAFDYRRSRYIEIASRVGLTTIDVTTAFDAHDDPRKLFESYNAHFSAEGATIAADAIIEGIPRAPVAER